MIYVPMWSHMLNNVRFLVSDLSNGQGRLITSIKKFHPNGDIYRL